MSSRSAENLFWMGRYAERAEQGARLARSALILLSDDARAPSPVLDLMATLCVEQGLLPKGVPSPMQSLPVFERTLIASLVSEQGTGVAFSLAAFVRTASHVRDRLSPDHWRLVASTADAFAVDRSKTGSSETRVAPRARSPPTRSSSRSEIRSSVKGSPPNSSRATSTHSSRDRPNALRSRPSCTATPSAPGPMNHRAA